MCSSHLERNRENRETEVVTSVIGIKHYYQYGENLRLSAFNWLDPKFTEVNESISTYFRLDLKLFSGSYSQDAVAKTIISSFLLERVFCTTFRGT